MEFILNGVKKSFSGDPEMPLLDYLREHEGITSAKDGCKPQAACGACSVEVDGKARLSCVWKMKRVEGSEVTTIEGMEQKLQDTFAHAFVEKSGVQCGFCIPGIVVQSKVLLDNNPDPSR
ncbi:MAG TPA: 2Fe-2S iron-sulfur cluster binding domain-containing protein, partial [Trueperaceae bacterium]|nr:2Fe-2S iron-sulfur cluster binding domain-containing protein [Trueperaceae bacterium]